MRLPNFLIVGAMKAGTTTLYHDLRSIPGIFMPDVKEPPNLTSDAVLSDEGRRQYASLFMNAPTGQCCGEASTESTKRPTFEGVAQRAKKLLGSDVRIVYMVRDPVDRTLSHFRHSMALGTIEPSDLARALREYPQLLDYSRYAMQMDPWLDAIGRDHIHIVHFEKFVRNREDEVKEILNFLNVPVPDHLVLKSAYNRAKDVRQIGGPLGRIRETTFYQHRIRALLPPIARQRLKRLLLSKPQITAKASESDLSTIRNELHGDTERFYRQFGFSTALWKV